MAKQKIVPRKGGTKTTPPKKKKSEVKDAN